MAEEDVRAGREFGEESLTYVSDAGHVVGGGCVGGTPPDEGIEVFGEDWFWEVSEVFFH